jgi:hypothetical protein
VTGLRREGGIVLAVAVVSSLADRPHARVDGSLGPRRPVADISIMSGSTVRRDKAALFQWVQAPPGQSLQPEATGAVMEATRWLKPSDSGPRIGCRRECTGRNASERRAILEMDAVQADPTGGSGKADMAG